MQTINLQLPSGYEILEKTQMLKTSKALDLLLSGKQSEFSKATNNYNGTITLFYSVIKCPYCGNELPVKNANKEALSRDVIVQWSSGQLTLFEQENPDLIFRKKSFINKTIYCPCCKKESKKAERYYDVVISKKRGKIKVSCLFTDLKELLNIGYVDNLELKAPFYYYETIVFNLYNGHTYIQIENQDRNAICTRDITENPDCIKNGMLYNLLLTNQNLRKMLKKFFKDGNIFKFHSKTMTFEDLVLATRFVGFNKGFYNTIPFCIGTYKLFPGFKSISKSLHIAKKIPVLYERLKLPTNKATRRIIFSNPGLLFYYYEIKRLYEAINNIDYFNRLLSLEHIYFILAKINCYPIISEFIQEAFRYEISSVVMKQMENNFYSFAVYAIRYMSMTEIAKKIERKREKWLHKCGEYAYGEYSSVLPSVVRFAPNEEIIDCEIDGYRFEWLVTSSDYEKAGQKMHNCLASTYQPVIVIKSNSNYIAAIAFDILNYERITQAFMCNNSPIHNSAPLCEAIRKWCKRYNVEWNEYEDEDYAF